MCSSDLHKRGRYSNIKLKPYFSQRRERLEFRGSIMGIRESDKGVGPKATSEDDK